MPGCRDARESRLIGLLAGGMCAKAWSMPVPVLRRCGAVRRGVDAGRAKYEMTLTVRSHIGADDDAFNAIRQREDEDGIRGICLQRNVVPTAALALKTNISSLAPHVLPLTELVRALAPVVAHTCLRAVTGDVWVRQAVCASTGALHSPMCVRSPAPKPVYRSMVDRLRLSGYHGSTAFQAPAWQRCEMTHHPA